MLYVFYISVASCLYDPATAAEGFRCPNPDYCYGYENIDSNGCYLATVKLSCGKTNVESLQDELLQGIVAYGRCEKNDAFIGQINMIAVSSFTGPKSGVWGLDYARHPDLYDEKNLIDTRNIVQQAGMQESMPMDLDFPVKVYNIQPLLEATEQLYGNVFTRAQHFPPLPGAHVPCAVKSANSDLDDKGNPVPGYVWSYIALAVANDRQNDSSLFIEDCGFHASVSDSPETTIVPYLADKQDRVINCVILCGTDLLVPYKEIFIGCKYLYCGPNEYGQALACAPYVLLAGSAYPDGSAKKLVETNLTEWAEAVLPKGVSKKDKGKRSK